MYLTAEEMAEADRATIEDYGVDVLSLMENAGGAVALVARAMLGGRVSGKEVCLLSGKGNNGGDALVAARRLYGWGATPRVILGGAKSEVRDIPSRQLESVVRMEVPLGGPNTEFGSPSLIVDGLLGYGSKGDPHGPVADLIRRANGSGAPILAVDIPSGLDATTGLPGDPCIAAKATVTFGFPKLGFLSEGARRVVGELYLADISFPPQVYQNYSQDPGIFAGDPIVRVQRGRVTRQRF